MILGRFEIENVEVMTDGRAEVQLFPLLVQPVLFSQSAPRLSRWSLDRSSRPHSYLSDIFLIFVSYKVQKV